MCASSFRFWRTTRAVLRITRVRLHSSGCPAMLRKVDVAAMRMDYKTPVGFDESGLVAREPFMQFDAWFKKATEDYNIGEANAMILSTCGRDCRPSARVVLLKGYDNTGFTFFTNYDSKKGEQLVKIEGKVEKISDKESEEYFHSRPRGSQIGAAVSNQSSVIASREVLKMKEDELKEKYADEQKPIPKPENWGGFKVIPDKVEFWQGQSSRLHDRILFRKPGPDEVINENLTSIGDDGWVYERLAP